MTTLTIELSETLFQQAQQQGFSTQSLEQMVNHWIQAYFQSRETPVIPATPATLTPEEETKRAIIAGQIVESCEGKPYRYPSVGMPVSSLDAWMNLITVGYEGDALADTEAVYDEEYAYEN